jgi:hypothetical protein
MRLLRHFKAEVDPRDNFVFIEEPALHWFRIDGGAVLNGAVLTVDNADEWARGSGRVRSTLYTDPEGVHVLLVTAATDSRALLCVLLHADKELPASPAQDRVKAVLAEKDALHAATMQMLQNAIEGVPVRRSLH